MRQAILLVVIAALQLALRVLFQGVPVVPHYIDFNPGIALVPAAGCFLGPAGAVVSAVASLAGDWWLGMWSALSIFRGAGCLFFALSAGALWPVARRLGWPGFILAGAVGSLVAASWTGIGMDLTRSYPFAYASTIVLVHDAAFCLVMGPGLSYLGRGLAGPDEQPWSFRAMWWVFWGAAGAWLMGIFVSGTFYRDWPFERYHLSDHSGIGLAFCVAPFLILNVMGAIRAVMARS
ncbi:MAG TPA: hypothetical protein VIH35_08490 [Kiritimatiellia bacterium]